MVWQTIYENSTALLGGWHDLPHRAQLSMSVNVSARQFAQPGLASNVRRIIDETGTVGAAAAEKLLEGAGFSK